MGDANAHLVECIDHVSGCVQPADRGLLIGVDNKITIGIAARPQCCCQLSTDVAANHWIDRIHPDRLAVDQAQANLILTFADGFDDRRIDDANAALSQALALPS